MNDKPRARALCPNGNNAILLNVTLIDTPNLNPGLSRPANSVQRPIRASTCTPRRPRARRAPF